MKYRAVKKNGYGECVSDNIRYIADHVDEWCGPYFDLYIDGVPVNNPQEYLKPYKKRTPVTLEEKIVDMCYTIDSLKDENKQLKEQLKKADSITQSCIFEGKEKSTINFRECLNKLELYKEVIEEVRGYIEEKPLYHYVYDEEEFFPTISEEKARKEILQILDKVKGE